MTSVFNPQEFLNATHEAGFITRRPNVPEGEYLAEIVEDRGNLKGIDVKAVDNKKGETSIILIINWQIVDDKAKEATGIDRPLVRQDIFLDVDEHGRLIKDKTHNADLGRLLDGLKLNMGSFAFPQLRTAGLCKIKVVLGKANDVGEQFSKVVAAVKYNGG